MTFDGRFDIGKIYIAMGEWTDGCVRVRAKQWEGSSARWGDALVGLVIWSTIYMSDATCC